MKIKALLLLALSLLPFAAHPQQIEASLVTAYPGRDVYQLEGHTGLRLVIPGEGDFVVNWGVFDFDSPNFLYRFVKGETDYLAAAFPTRYFLEEYAREGRRVVVRPLVLDSVQAERLFNLVRVNLLPENRVYRYNYVLDNCATRPLAMIERALGDTLALGRPDFEGDMTFRNVMRHYHRHFPWYQFGIDLALGSGIDRPITEREMSFVPVQLDTLLAKATLGGQLIAPEAFTLPARHDSARELDTYLATPTHWTLTPLFWGWAVFAIAFCVSVLQARGMARWGRWFDTLYFTLEGVAGLLLTFLIFVSVHEATSPNWLYLWLNPLCFIGAVAPWLKSGKRLEICYQIVNFALLIVLGAILALGVQSPNPAFVPLMAASALRAVANVYMLRK